MAQVPSLSAIETAFPGRLRPPQPLPGETPLQLVIRNHPQDWQNCVTWLATELGLSRQIRRQLLAARVDAVGRDDPRVREEIETFVNRRLPTHERTLQSLANLREMLVEPAQSGQSALRQLWGFALVEILWPCAGHPPVSVQDLAEGMGVKLILYPMGAERTIDLAGLLPHVHGDFLWLVPGGTLFMATMVAMQLRRVLGLFTASPEAAFYTDGADSIIYRTAALHELVRRGQGLPADAREMARVMQESGYETMADDNPAAALCELEAVYGGRRQNR